MNINRPQQKKRRVAYPWTLRREIARCVLKLEDSGIPRRIAGELSSSIHEVPRRHVSRWRLQYESQRARQAVEIAECVDTETWWRARLMKQENDEAFDIFVFF